MKKFLLFALFAVSNAMTMSPEQLLDLSKQENPTESQIEAFANCFNWDFAKTLACHSVLKMFDAKPDLFLPADATKQQIADVRHNLLIKFWSSADRLSAWQIAEMNMISREPKKSEEAAISKFVQALNLPSGYFWNEGRDHVRIIDGSSYINGLFLDRSRKDYYLSFLSDLEADLPLENSLPKIPKTDFNRVIDQTRNSLTYRTLMVSFLARNEAKLPISARYPTAEDGEMIIPSENQGIRLASNERSYMKVDELGLNLSDVRSYFRTLFASSYSNKVLAEGTYPFFSNSEFILFHELGHYIDHWASSELFAKVSKGLSYLPAAAFLNLDTTNLENKLALPNLPQQANQDTLNDLFYLAEMHFDSTPEIWQILGLKLFEDSKGNKTLYINKMSDFFLSCELGMPIRMDHSGIGISSIQMLIKPGTIVEAKYRLPLEAYGALMDVGVYSFGGYVLRLMYPYGLSSLLKNEYRLNLGWIKRLRMLPPQSPVAKS